MMTYLKCTIFTLIALAVPLQTEATFPGTEQTQTIKVSIIGHTGQDPVYRSLGSKTDYRNPTLKSIAVSKVLGVDTHSFIDSSDFSLEIGQEYISTTNPFGGFCSDIEKIISLDDVQFDSYSVSNSSTVPTPPAFLLLLAVAATRRRRNT
jgi:hypothetical protein